MMELTCECGEVVRGQDMGSLGDAFIGHVRESHKDWPLPDIAIRNYAEGTQRLAPKRPRVSSLADVEVHPVTEDRLDDWLAFFDREAFAGKPEWAACYCSEPHFHPRGLSPAQAEARTWTQNRETMQRLLHAGESFGYLAYVEGKPAGWVNASLRKDYALYREGEDAQPSDADVIGVSCFIIAPPYRRHGIASRLLDRVLADAPGRGASWVEAYPFNGEDTEDAGNFRGPPTLYEERGFVSVEDRGPYSVWRRRA